jgi:hypothetical protein
MMAKVGERSIPPESRKEMDASRVQEDVWWYSKRIEFMRNERNECCVRLSVQTNIGLAAWLPQSSG